MDLNQEYKELISKCKLLPCIKTIKDCKDFYKIFYKMKLYDAEYGAKDHKDYRDKPIDTLTLNEVLTSFTVIQREHYWTSGDDDVFRRYIEDKTLEKLYKKLQEFCI